MTFKSIKGTRDILPSETGRWQYVESAVRTVFHRFNYKEIRTPAFEQTALFARGIGELTDIVGKEMYTLQDRGGESITLKPEGTASVIRSYIQNNLGESQPLVKLYYIAPMFRQERPQAGRLRQFHQFGAEAIGTQEPEIDAETIALTIQIYQELSITRHTLKINSVGCEKCRPAYRRILQEKLRNIAGKLSPESQQRIDRNPLRVLDSKDERDIKLTADMPFIVDHLCRECSEHFAEVRRLLAALEIQYIVDKRLVRGLDYYTKTAFELISPELGSQDALAGGGRYDLLTEELGGKPTPGVGFAAGIERLMMVLEKKGTDQSAPFRPALFIAAADDDSRTWSFATTMRLRADGIAVETDFLKRSLKAQMREANRQDAMYVLVVGRRELDVEKGVLKRLSDGTEREISLKSIREYMQER